MRIALLSDEYLPSGTRIHSKMFHDLALEFKKNGHYPIVITPGSPHQDSKLIIDYIDGVEIWRFKSGYTRGVGMLRRAINEWLLPFRAWSAIKAKFSSSYFDLCINYAPTIFFGPLAKRFKCNGTFVYLVLRDMFPQWIIDQGLIKENSIPAYFFRYYEKLNYNVADCIGVQSQANLDLFTKRFPELENIRILRNWASTAVVPATKQDNALKARLGISDKVVFFYGGNIGRAQDMENIMRLAKNLIDVQEAHFLILGQGDAFNLIVDLKSRWELDNVTILPAVSQSEFSRILATIDVGLFSLSYHHSAHNFPGKLLGYMIESKPILGSVNPGNDLLEVINTCDAGWVFVNGQDQLLAEAAIRLVFDSQLRQQAGSKARELLLQQFSVESAACDILSTMEQGR